MKEEEEEQNWYYRKSKPNHYFTKLSIILFQMTCTKYRRSATLDIGAKKSLASGSVSFYNTKNNPSHHISLSCLFRSAVRTYFTSLLLLHKILDRRNKIYRSSTASLNRSIPYWNWFKVSFRMCYIRIYRRCLYLLHHSPRSDRFVRSR